MALLESTVTPFASAVGSSTVTSASFTPTAGALLVAIASNSNGTALAANPLAITDSTGSGSWKKLVQQPASSSAPWSDCSVWVKDVGPSPVPMTVTATSSGPAAHSTCLGVRQFLGAEAAVNQVGVTRVQTTQSESCTITPGTTGSQVVGAFGDAGDPVSWVPATGTSLYGQFIGADSDSAVLMEASSLSVVSTPITLGFTNSGRPGFPVVFALAEILPLKAIFPTEANYGDVAVNETFDRLVSYALQSNRFRAVNQHEPKGAPGNGPACSIWIQRIKPLRSSGQAATSIVVVFSVRMYVSFTQQPYDMIDPQITSATTQFMAALSGDFAFSSAHEANVRHVDLLGASGYQLEAQAGYMEIDRHMYRVMTLTVPVIVNDAFIQVA